MMLLHGKILSAQCMTYFLVWFVWINKRQNKKRHKEAKVVTTYKYTHKVVIKYCSYFIYLNKFNEERTAVSTCANLHTIYIFLGARNRRKERKVFCFGEEINKSTILWLIMSFKLSKRKKGSRLYLPINLDGLQVAIGADELNHKGNSILKAYFIIN